MARVVAEKGYATATVADVVEHAGVSRRTFYELFPDKESCFLAAYDTGVEVMLGRIRAAVESLPRTDWRRRARVSIETYLEVLATEADFAWCFHVEVLAAGPTALARRAAIHGLFAGLWREIHERARREDPARPVLPDEVFPVLTAGLEELIREHLRARGAASLPQLAEPIWQVVQAILDQRAG